MPPRLLPLALLLLATGCATVQSPQHEPVRPPALEAPPQPSPQGRVLKQRIAVGRFSNESHYGRGLWRDGDGDPMGKQASDMMMGRLIQSGRFQVFERPDADKVLREQKRLGIEGLPGVETLLIGSITEFGRSTSGKVGFLSATKNQVARAKVEIRLVDVRTGEAWFTASGAGEANTETGHVAGYGSRADYDASLNDRAIGAAVSDAMNSILQKLGQQPWRADVLKADSSGIVVAAGAHQGLKEGDVLTLLRAGEKVGAQGLSLPAVAVGRVRVTRLFGSTPTDQGALCSLLEGSIPSGAALHVTDAKE